MLQKEPLQFLPGENVLKQILRQKIHHFLLPDYSPIIIQLGQSRDYYSNRNVPQTISPTTTRSIMQYPIMSLASSLAIASAGRAQNG